MRCLYCGKELALLKRWTGGGEFCSDAHRQRYQEEYNQLALNRLLQAKPPKPDAPAPAEGKPAKPAAVAEPVREVSAPSAPPSPARIAAPIPEPATLKVSEGTRSKPAYQEARSQVAVREATVDPVPPPQAARIQEPARIEAPAPIEVAVAEPEVAAPADPAGFLVELPDVAQANVAPMSRPELEFLSAVAAALPFRTSEPLDVRRDPYQLETAGLVTYEPAYRASNYSGSGRERRLEVRDFVRTAPVVEINLSPAGETGLETTSEAMDILIFPQPPQGLPVLWQEPAVGFSGGRTELGELARLDFATTGFTGEEQESAVAVVEPPEVAPEPVQLVVEVPPAIAEPEPEPVPEPVIEAAPEPEPVAVQAVEPPVEQPIEEAAAPIVEQPVAQIAEPEEKPEVLPELATTPLPLTLHVAAPSKGKPMQVFSAAANAVETQVPRSTSLPLRPTITLGPAPAPSKNEAKSEPKPEPKKPASAPVRPDPRLANVKIRQQAPAQEVQQDSKPAAKAPVPEPPKETAVKQVAKTETPSPTKSPLKVEARQDKKPEAKETVKLKEEPKSAPVLPAPLAAPYPGSSDLGLPHLNLQSSSGFLGQLPMVAKIGIVVVLLAGIGALIAFSSKSGGAATKEGAGTIVAGSALPAGESGWITDWGADPGVRRTRQISILRSSQTLTDYRIEMNGQIESKAIGWVFRAQDPKNFYVTKLEIVKPGLEPTVALVRFAIINGEEQAHAQLPLPMKVRLDTMYKIRFDALGNHFTTFVQDQKVDDWTDDHVKTGGVGFYRERGEDATLKGGMNVVPLIVKK